MSSLRRSVPLFPSCAPVRDVPHKLSIRRPLSRFRHIRRLLHLRQDCRGFAAAEAVMLAVVLCGLALMCAKILIPAAKTAAHKLHAELAGSR